ncbi:MAG: bifunctional sterol desaturase/short chain dehydrogenase [Oscillatoriaceae bacterium SKW80]|nr:bifunctional sterol desaturase/short chain dehydrogenase [Oscillatoriaceae bacterium SKYG93]MCX8120167.1 bifunctional sterol desaturase/short chain dehydrogenase [Oscillatoriaceae bacterium SKW80]MDW8453093.1 bifunctional sterol desaturase/short chain dehydrogenase [Oscillatoriaceae cyanobacterium SKYGB_i_bin93]HIK28996.1 bifunctional sterol desaturase/short chain dehydrogenase [Oscillatoriaceae cyanobacterium M7585_C2015_266]
MDFNLLFSQPIVQLLLGLISIVFAEVVRDIYHIAGHYWKPLQNFHNLHHKAYRPDLSITSLEAYKKAQLYNDVPEAFVMLGATALVAEISRNYGMWFGCLYSLMFLIPALARSQGFLLVTDFSHKQGELVDIPSFWIVNRTYHWRHHFDRGDAYFCGYFTLVDKILGTSLSLKGKVVAITGSSGTLGRALIEELLLQGAKIIAITTASDAQFQPEVEVWQWQLGAEDELAERLKKIDILIINHGINVYGDRTYTAIQKSYQVNTFSVLKLTELFLQTVTQSSHKAIKEVWINTSEAEVNPAFSPLYELSKRTIGDLITLRRLDAPCVIRKLVLGPFKSQLNPYGVMSARWVAWAIVALAKRDFRNIIVTINPITYIAFPIKEFFQSLYFSLFTKSTEK